jgi:hypothetical protein
MIFKMSTQSGSNVALGNNKAYTLPDIKGRGIWAGGNQYIEVQAPYLSELELDKECKQICELMKKHGKYNHQPMIELDYGPSLATQMAYKKVRQGDIFN